MRTRYLRPSMYKQARHAKQAHAAVWRGTSRFPTPRSPRPSVTQSSSPGRSRDRIRAILLSATAAAVLAGAGAAPASAAVTAGGWKLENHWLYTDVLANKSMTTTVAAALPDACGALLKLFKLPAVGGGIGVAPCSLGSWSKVAAKAEKQRRCFRLVLPAHNHNLAYPSTYKSKKRGWCR